MATISENLQIIADSTTAIKQAIIDKGGTITGDITTWASAINGISGGGSGGGSSEEEVILRGKISNGAMSVTITGTLYVPSNIRSGFLVAMDYYMQILTASTYINSTGSINLTLSYGEPLGGTEIPVLIYMYILSGDSNVGWRCQVVKVLTDGEGSGGAE